MEGTHGGKSVREISKLMSDIQKHEGGMERGYGPAQYFVDN